MCVKGWAGWILFRKKMLKRRLKVIFQILKRCRKHVLDWQICCCDIVLFHNTFLGLVEKRFYNYCSELIRKQKKVAYLLDFGFGFPRRKLCFLRTSGASPTRCSTSPEPSTPSARPESYSKTHQNPRKVRLSGIFCIWVVFRRSGGAVRKTARGMKTII